MPFKQKIGNPLSVELRTPQDMLLEIAGRFKARRLSMNLTQEGVAARSGVSWSSLKRFERTGLIAFNSLLRIALVLDCLSDFDRLTIDNSHAVSARSLDDILSEPKTRKKGQIK
jgi:transcriptional regulator with XRE-family HTH domain